MHVLSPQDFGCLDFLKQQNAPRVAMLLQQVGEGPMVGQVIGGVLDRVEERLLGRIHKHIIPPSCERRKVRQMDMVRQSWNQLQETVFEWYELLQPFNTSLNAQLCTAVSA